eukprot:9095739-Alexandrium_andersonii.AAC.1
MPADIGSLWSALPRAIDEKRWELAKKHPAMLKTCLGKRSRGKLRALLVAPQHVNRPTLPDTWGGGRGTQ